MFCLKHTSFPFRVTSATTISSSEISLTWTKGDYANKTVIRYKESSYPSGPTDGSLAYYDIGASCLLGDLDSGVTYFFGAWSFAYGEIWSDREPYSGVSDYTMGAGSNSTTVEDVAGDLEFTDDDYYNGCTLYNVTRSDSSVVSDYDGTGTPTITLETAISGQTSGDDYYLVLQEEFISTTLAGLGASGTGDPWSFPDEPSNWVVEPRCTGLVDMPGYGLVYDSAESLGMEPAYMFFFVWIIIAMIGGILTFVATRHSLGVLGMMGLILLIGLFAGPIPGWVFFLYLLIGSTMGYVLAKGANV